MSDAILDRTLVRALRLQAGLSRRRLARLVGLTAGVIQRIENGRSHGELTLRKLESLADALATSPTALYHRQPVEPSADDIVLEAALATSPTFLRAEELARGLGWDLTRTHTALRALRNRLQATGQDVRRTSNGYALVARLGALTRRQHTELERTRVARRGLNITAARLLYRIYTQQPGTGLEQRLRNPDRVALGALLRAGLVEHAADRYVLSRPACTSLAPPSTGSTRRAQAKRRQSSDLAEGAKSPGIEMSRGNHRPRTSRTHAKR